MSEQLSDDYPDFVARFYDVVYAQVRSGVDERFYLDRVAACGGPVLELGVGTGRHFRAALALGADIYGVDSSPSMIARCREQLEPADAHRVQVADAVTMRMERRFALITAPFRMLSHVLTVEDQLRLLDNVHDHLVPGGRFIFDVYVPAPKILAEGFNGFCDFDGEHAPGQRLQRFISARADVVGQITRATMTFVWDEDGRRHTRDWSFRLRFFFRYELEHLIARSRLRLETIYGDFEGGPLRETSKELAVLCRRGPEPSEENAA